MDSNWTKKLGQEKSFQAKAIRRLNEAAIEKNEAKKTMTDDDGGRKKRGFDWLQSHDWREYDSLKLLYKKWSTPEKNEEASFVIT